jgi:hypothetical protein
MIRIPIRKLYRAFPELDQFSDAQCEQFVQRARQTQGFADTAIAAPIAALVGTCLFMSLAQYWLNSVAERVVIGAVGRAMAQQLYPAILVTLWVIVLAMSALVARDLVLWRFLKRAIWKRIEKIRCDACKYSLLGQRASDGCVRCPECGAVTTLQLLGVESEADLMPPAELRSGVM